MGINLQDAYLLQVKKNRELVTIYLVNGIQLRGAVKGFDNFTVFIENHDGKIQLVYKHAITTVQTVKSSMSDFIAGQLNKEATAHSKES
ncbi:MAG: RNA chaperone Hfq [Armatimonadota bacterium]